MYNEHNDTFVKEQTNLMTQSEKSSCCNTYFFKMTISVLTACVYNKNITLKFPLITDAPFQDKWNLENILSCRNYPKLINQTPFA